MSTAAAASARSSATPALLFLPIACLLLAVYLVILASLVFLVSLAGRHEAGSALRATGDARARRLALRASPSPQPLALLPGPPLDEPVDAVYTFVDDADPQWQLDLHDALAAGGAASDETAVVRRAPLNRFRDWGELRYSLRSLRQFASWVRTVFLVVATPSQVPTWLEVDEAGEGSAVRVVVHAQLFDDPSNQLPTFNSLAIESVLHRIPRLSRRFLYVNNDLMLARAVPLALFRTHTHYRRFTDWRLHRTVECRPLLRIATAPLRGGALDNVFSGPMARRCMRREPFFFDDVLALATSGAGVSHWAPHIPHLWDRDVLAEALDGATSELAPFAAQARRNRLRAPESDVSAHYQMEARMTWQFRHGREGAPAVEDAPITSADYSYVLMQGFKNDSTIFERTEAAIARGVRFVGIDDDLPHNASAALIGFFRMQISSFFERHWPEPAPWELDHRAPAVAALAATAEEPDAWAAESALLDKRVAR